ncbi:flippase [Altericista sp. CCNU0014]|uniref:flippase n=1 Tax=Altericista sp. CCNU0014 TaxID=3082949 RepID=UPI00384D617C
MPKADEKEITKGQSLVWNTLYSFLGQGVPLIVALGSMPILIRGLGTDRFGILTLIWMVISYFSLFDLGLGRALTQMVAEKTGAGKYQEIPPLMWTASFLMLILGIVGTFVLIALTPTLIYGVLKIPAELRNETEKTFYLLALSVPLITSTAGLVGFLSALQRFDLINIVRIPMSMFMFVGPILVIQFSNSLFPVTLTLVLSRFINWAINLWQCFNVMPDLKKRIVFDKTQLPAMLKFGGWMTVTNIVGPLMVYLDRFLIGSVISISAVAFYTTPYEVVTKLWIIPNSLINVLFPAFTTSHQTSVKSSSELFEKAIIYIFFVLFPVVLLTTTFAQEGLYLWLGADFSRKSSLVLQILAIGIFINSFANIAYTFIQGIGKPNITAKLHLLELPFYLLLVWHLAKIHGIVGVAIAWVLRIAVDAILLFYIADNFLTVVDKTKSRMILILLASMVLILISINLKELQAKIIFSSISLITISLAAYYSLDLKNIYKKIFKPG